MHWHWYSWSILLLLLPANRESVAIAQIHIGGLVKARSQCIDHRARKTHQTMHDMIAAEPQFEIGFQACTPGSPGEIGRASCRERVWRSESARSREEEEE